MLVAGTAFANERVLINDDMSPFRALGDDIFAVPNLGDAEELLNLAKEKHFIEIQALRNHWKFVKAWTHVDVIDYGDHAGESGDMMEVRVKGTDETFWVPRFCLWFPVGTNRASPLYSGLFSIAAPTPTPAPMSDAERKQMEEGWKQFEEADKKERELLQKQEAQRKAQYEAQQAETPVIIGAKPAPQ